MVENEFENRCWLSELEKFRETEGRSQRENFFTAVFAWALSVNEDLRHPVLSRIFFDRAICAGNIDFSCAIPEIHSRNDAGKIPDMVVIVRRPDGTPIFAGAIECKIDARHDEPQKVTGYLGALRNSYSSVSEDNIRVAYVCKKPMPRNFDDNVKISRWADIYAVIEETLKKRREGSRESGVFLTLELMDFMKRIGLAQMKAVRPKAISKLEEVEGFLRSAESLIHRVADTLVHDTADVSDLTLGKSWSRPKERFFGDSLHHQAGKFGVYIIYSPDEVFAVTYISIPEKDDSKQTVVFDHCRDSLSWGRIRETSDWPGIGCKLDLLRNQDFPHTFDRQVEFIANWATKNIGRACEFYV